MATLNELAETLAERAGRQFDNPFLLEMKVLVNVWSARLKRDSLERNKKDRAYFRQYIEVPLVKVNISELPGFPNIPVLRTKCTLPNPLRANGIFFDFAGSPDKLSTFKVFSEQHELLASLGGRYTGGDPKALWLNNYIYVFNEDDLPYLGVATVFEDPRAVTTENCGCTTATCYDDDKEYPVSWDLQQRIIQSILATELRAILPANTEQVRVDAPDKV